MAGLPALIADIGGTHARFALVDESGAIGEMMVYRCREHAGPAEAAQLFLDHMKPAKAPVAGAFAVASALSGDRVEMTNAAWSFSIAELQARLGFERLQVVNDFTAVALSVRHIHGADLMEMGGGAPLAGAPIAVLGPGTGLGVSGLVPAPSGEWVALATEGGHVTMAATDPREAQVLDILRARYGHVSAERVLSGPGLVNLYQTLCTLTGVTPAAEVTPPWVLEQAGAGGCPVCADTLRMFFAMMGTVAGNLALSLGAKGGVFIGGGILPRVKDAFRTSDFRRRFEDKGRFGPYLSEIPVWLILHPEPAFAGLAAMCRRDEPIGE
ncbi:MAG: glucokinase [Alphaproteobacteria bacterium]|nr:glucokinase [Alphaproteobacteria bacterium]